MPVTYMYIDDQPEKAGGIEAGLSATENVKVKLFPAQSWVDQIQTIYEQRKNYDGLLLDLQLRLPEGKLLYDAPALAQQLRNLAKEGKLEDWPIVLCTTDDLYLAVYDKSTNDDLFDRIYYKEHWSPISEENLKEFVSLVTGYEQIKAGFRTQLNFQDLLKISNPAITSQVEDKLPEAKTVHGIASFLLKQLVLKSGLLIDEQLLAIRLGIDKDLSADWFRIKELIIEFQYKGVFSDGWERWWAGDIMKWWRQVSEGGSLRNSAAPDKVSILKGITGLNNLVTLSLPEHHTQSSFWYKCHFSKNPLNSEDGIMIKGQDKNFDWQDKEYISINYLWNVASKKKEEDVINSVSINDVEKIKAVFHQKRQA